VLVICFYQLPADANHENLSAVFFIYLNWHLLQKHNLWTRKNEWGEHPIKI
jgi:hypothetical protein